MNDVGNWIADLSRTNLVSETDVRSHVAVPLLEMLGWPNENRAEEFPIFANEGRRPLPAKPADVVLFDSSDHHARRDRGSRGWVADHALLVLELKKPGESLDEARGQAQFYSHWARVPFYALTDGEELAVYRMQGFFDDAEEERCPLAEVPRRWPRLAALLGYANVRRYCAENAIKSRPLPAVGYSDYVRALYLDLQEELSLSLDRTVSDADDPRGARTRGLLLGAPGVSPARPFPVGLTGEAGGRSLSGAPYGALLETGASVVVLSEPGGGKSHLVRMLARDLAGATEGDADAPRCR